MFHLPHMNISEFKPTCPQNWLIWHWWPIVLPNWQCQYAKTELYSFLPHTFEHTKREGYSKECRIWAGFIGAPKPSFHHIAAPERLSVVKVWDDPFQRWETMLKAAFLSVLISNCCHQTFADQRCKILIHHEAVSGDAFNWLVISGEAIIDGEIVDFTAVSILTLSTQKG